MVTAGFFVLLTIAVISANRMVIESNKDYLKTEAVEQATNFANALIGEILTKKFDSQVDYSYYQAAYEFDYAMGPASNAANYVNPGGAPDVVPYKSVLATSGNYFDDMDDYHGYKRTANSADISGYLLTVSVYYIRKSSPNTSSGTQTYFKRIDVTVSHSVYLPKNLTFSAIATY